jgi:hypothetical protein
MPHPGTILAQGAGSSDLRGWEQERVWSLSPPSTDILRSRIWCLSSWKSELRGGGGIGEREGQGVCLFKCTLCQCDKEFDGFIRNTKALFSRVRLTPLNSTQSADK